MPWLYCDRENPESPSVVNSDVLSGMKPASNPVARRLWMATRSGSVLLAISVGNLVK